MRLDQFMEEIAYGELSDLSMSEGATIKDDKKPLIVIKLNDVITNLYNKYIIRLVDDIIDTSVKMNTYQFINENSVQIVYVKPHEASLDEIYENRDYFRVQGNTLYFNKPPKADAFEIKYQYKPLRLRNNPATQGFLSQEVEVTEALLPLVRTLVAASIYNGMNGEMHKATAVGLRNDAEYMRVDLESMGVLVNSVDFKNRQFEKNGFV